MNPRRLVLLAVSLSAALLAWSSPAMSGRVISKTPDAIVQLTTDPASDLRPVWSPDGRQIAFQSNRDGPFHIYLMNADGSDQHPLTKGANDDRHPEWMPDGKVILFDSSDGTHSEIWSVGAADGKLRQLTHLGAVASFAAPSRDGSQIVFYNFRNEMLNLWTARADGSGAKELTWDLASAANNQCTFPCHPAAWSPDNQSLAYSGGDQTSIWMMRSDGSDPNPIVAAKDENDHFPWFLADGRLGFITEHVVPSQAWTDAWAYDLRTGERTLLQGRMSVQGPMAWSTDNKRVLFHSPRSGNFDIYLIDLNAPGGLAALQGTPVPIQAASSSPKPTAPAASSIPGVGVVNPAVYAVGAAAAASMAALGLFVWWKARKGLR